MSKRLYVDIKEDCNGNLTGPVRFPADGTFVFEVVLLVLEEFGKSVNIPVSEIIRDMFNFQRMQERKAEGKG